MPFGPPPGVATTVAPPFASRTMRPPSMSTARTAPSSVMTGPSVKPETRAEHLELERVVDGDLHRLMMSRRGAACNRARRYSPRMNAPTALRVEHLDSASLGVGEPRPRLSWRLPDGARAQRSYRVELDGQVLAELESADSVLVPWPGDDVGSRQRVEWRVKVGPTSGRATGRSPRGSRPGSFDPTTGSREWIEPWSRCSRRRATPGARAPHDVPARSDRRTARMYATAHGVYETLPQRPPRRRSRADAGLHRYWAHLHVQVYDVGRPAARRGERVAGGAERRLVPRASRQLAVLRQLRRRGRVPRPAPGRRRGGHDRPRTGRRATRADPCRRPDGGPGRGPPGRTGGWASRRGRRPRLHPARLFARAADARGRAPCGHARCAGSRPTRQVVDLGQNINGRVRLTRPRPARHDARHSCTARRSTPTATSRSRTSPTTSMCAGQTDRVVSAGPRRATSFEPRHTTHGFQYVQDRRASGTASRPTTSTGVVVHTDLRRTGWFRCSDERINRFHEIADWSFRGNACDDPDRLPDRERAGWTGDWQVFLPSAAFLYDVAGFSLKWLRDLAPSSCPTAAPQHRARPQRPRGRERTPSDYWTLPPGLGRLGRRDRDRAVGAVPALRRPRVLAELWPTMVRWVDYAADAARTKRHPGRAEARPEPAPHEEYLWDGGFHWGEWWSPAARSSDVLGSRPGPRRHRLPAPQRRARSPGSAGSSGHDDEADALRRRSPPTRSMRGAPSTSPPTAR